jgi:hypothetical protein
MRAAYSKLQDSDPKISSPLSMIDVVHGHRRFTFDIGANARKAPTIPDGNEK